MRLNLPGQIATVSLVFACAVTVAFASPKPSASAGQKVLEANHCTMCHSLKGVGGKIGPDLAGVGSRRKPDWIAKQIEDPKSHNAKSIMPSFAQLSKREREDLVAYLSTLKEVPASR